ncbi:MAG: SH3 domain-containing protein [Clostridia bacterium]|nr:SH3 domain-containing protein [Clostridia bacterium]
MIRRGFALAALLALLCVPALADSVPLEQMDVSNHESFGFGRTIGFAAGCVEASGTRFLLVDTLGFNGHYLLVDPIGNGQWESFSGGMKIEEGSWVSLEAQDAMHCRVRIERNGVSERWDFAELPDPESHPDWVLMRYERAEQDGDCFSAAFGECYADVTQTAGEQTQSRRVYYAFFRDANNLDYDKLPRSLEEAVQLEKKYPVAAVSPKNPGDRVNLREGPSTSRSRAGSLYSGTLLTIREIQDGWAHVYVGDAGLWISTDFLTFGEAIEQVVDSTIPMRLRGDGEWVKVSRMPYDGGGGTVTQRMGGTEVRVIGEYNSKWRIVGDGHGSVYVHAEDLE